MNKNDSVDELNFLPRRLAPQFGRAVAEHPVVVLTGARQTGKSTLLRHEEPTKRWKYVTLDNLDALRQGERDPAGLWAGAERVILDEVQRLPGIFSAVKQAVDEHPRKMRFVLSGSANLLLMRHVSESLAGRAVYLTLLPMTAGEIRRGGPPAFARNRTTRLIKAPKLHWIDPALAAYLGGLHDEASIRASREAGALFENLIFHHLKALAGTFTPKLRLYYWRTMKGAGVDLVVEWGRKVVAIEVKLTDSPSYADCEGLEAFLKEHPEANAGILVHTGR